MASQDLHELLRRLHAELGSANSLDAESRRLLGVVIDDVQRMGADPSAAAGAATPGGLEALAVRFEAEHPSMAAALRQVADVLGKAGL